MPTLPIVKQKFDEFNALIFDSKLPPLPMLISNAKGFLGKFEYTRRHSLLGGVSYSDMRIRISCRFDLSEQELEDTIIHEMIHYYIAYHNVKDTSAHGMVFRKMMAEINAKYGRNISISHKKTDSPLVDRCAERRKWHVVAVVDFCDGRRGFKVLPKVAKSIVWYRKSVMAAPEIRNVEIYWSLHTLFNSFPVSKALKVHFVDLKKLDVALAESERMEKV